ncbi:tRNA synthetase subunit beta [Bacillus sp. FJAT-18017]|uniref:B3/B4 domain-containing protein n=1 Tax=Bacillus sp. FJAT-18017 TaxID=1705566 RepID=UPI0006B04A43|nr:phenylalanine--tRNA ligase beta subunit-related protein [Bacillus sp. FJAT-18017]ALC92094.1 tRNA synthetase subunit beta [Bacillus sp. FJAT-18017]
MEIHIAKDLSELIPNFKLGVIFYSGINVGESPQMLKGRLQLFQESIFFDLEGSSVAELEGLKEWRQIFKTTGKDPNRYRPSVEALYRRIGKQNFLPSVQSAIDLNNFFSLQYQVPIGIYDTDQLKGDVSVRLGKSSEEYTGLNGRSNSLDKLIVSSDQLGPFGSPFVDSSRASVSETTTNALQLIYLRPSTNYNDAQKLTESLMKMFVQIHGGEGDFTIVESV